MNPRPTSNVALASDTESPISTPSTEQGRKKRTDEVHLVLQGKGGVGKSLVATLLAEYLIERVDQLQCFDTDPVNPTFSTYKTFNVTRIELFDDGRVNSRAFDDFMAPLLEPGASGLIDNGATTFIPLMDYMARMSALEMLLAAKKTVMIHTVIAGGDAMAETHDGFVQIMDNLPPDVQTVVWLNELHGPVIRNGVEFTESPYYQKVKDRVRGVVRMPAPWGDMFAHDLQELRQVRLSLGEAIDGKERPDTKKSFNVMERQRFTMIQRDYFQKMQAASV